MPGRRGKDYEPLRKPGEFWETPATAENGGKDKRTSEKENDEVTGGAVSGELQVETGKPVDEVKTPFAETKQKKESLEEKNQGIQGHGGDATLEVIAEHSSDKQQEMLIPINKTVLSEETLPKSDLLKEPSTESTDKPASLNPHAAEFVPGAALSFLSVADIPEFAQNERPPLLHKQISTEENELENFVKDVLFGLTESPGELPEYTNLLAGMLKKWLTKPNSLRETVNLIFEYSITEPNFQYIASRLCNSLSRRKDLCLPDQEKFRDIFLNRCRDEHLKREEYLKASDKRSRVFVFAMFLGELFCNYRPLGETEPLEVFHRALLEMLTTLLENGTEEALKCVGNISKMTGFLLDDTSFKKDKEREIKINKVFSEVEIFSRETTLSESVRDLLSQVIKLRASLWGMVTPSAGGLPGALAEDYYAQECAYGMGELALDDYEPPVTDPDQWNEYYVPEDEDVYLSNDIYSYYFPDQEYKAYSSAEGGNDYADEDTEFEKEYEKFLQELENVSKK